MPASGQFGESVRESIGASIAVKQQLLADHDLIAKVSRVTGILIDAFRAGNKVVLFGNGGSAADAQHIAAEFVGRFAFDRPALPALALSVNTSCVTAIGISTSGKSANVLRGMATAKKIGLHTVGLAGSGGGALAGAVDHCICAPSSETPRIQECHILIGHIISELVEQTIFHEESSLSRSRRSHQPKSS